MAKKILVCGLLFSLWAWSTPAGAQELDDDTQDPQGGVLSAVLQGLEWGADHETVIEHFRQQFMEDFRAEIAGIRDPLRVDEMRRTHEERADRIRDSYQVFDGARTGWEVSVLGDEVVCRAEESMLTVRTENAQLYYIFTSDQLFKIVVAYNSAYLGSLEFESFLEQVERRYGPPNSTEMAETQIGVRYLARALWQDDIARLRIENRSDLFGTFIMVFSSITLDEQAAVRRAGQGVSSGAVGVSDLVRSISEPGGSAANEDVVDEIIGGPTVVNLTVPEAQPTDEWAVGQPATQADSEEPTAVGTAATQQDEQVSAEAQEETEAEARARRRQRERQEAETDQAEQEGITIY